MPTILEIARLKPPQGLHGKSLTPLLAGRDVPWRDSLTIVNREAMPDPKDKNVCTSRGVRTRDWKLILRDRLSVRATHQTELYNMKKDPGELESVYGPERKGDIKAILCRLEAWARKVGDDESLDLAAVCRADLGL